MDDYARPELVCQSSLFSLPFFDNQNRQTKKVLGAIQGGHQYNTFVAPAVLFHNDKSRAYKVELKRAN